MHGQSAYGYAKRNMSTTAASETVAADSMEEPAISELDNGREPSQSTSQIKPADNSASSISSLARAGKSRTTLSQSPSSIPSSHSSTSSVLSPKQVGKLPASKAKPEAAIVQSSSARTQATSSQDVQTASSSSSIISHAESSAKARTARPKSSPYDKLEGAVMEAIPNLFNLSNSRSGISPEAYSQAVTEASKLFRQHTRALRNWNDKQTALIVTLFDAHVFVDKRKKGSNSVSLDVDTRLGLCDLATSIIGLACAIPMEFCGAMVATGVSIGDMYVSTLGWYASNQALEKLLRSQTAQPTYVEQMRQYLQLTLETLCNEIAQDLRLGQRISVNSSLQTGNPDMLKRYLDAVASYNVILDSLKKGVVEQSAYLQPIIKMMLLAPKSPNSAVSKEPSTRGPDVKGIGHKATTFQDASQDHSSAFDRAQAILERLLETCINDSQKIQSGSWRSDFILDAPSSTTTSCCEPQKGKRLSRAARTRWKLWPTVGKSTTAAQTPVSRSAANLIAPSTKTRIAKDIPSLLLLLRYAYQHLASFRAANAFYECVVGPALHEAGKSTDKAIRADLIKHQEYCDIMRLRGGSLLRQDAEVDKIILDIITRLADEEDQNARQAGVSESTLKQWREEQVYGVSMWLPQTLLRSESVSNALVTAIVSHWTATSNFEFTRYFIHHFMALRAHIRLGEEVQLGHPAEEQSEDIEGPGPNTGRARFDKWVSSSELLVVMLNAACKAGTVSLSEHLWIVARREERRAAWILPVQAYTIMFQAQARQAAKELSEARSGRKEVFSWSLIEQQDSGNESGSDCGSEISQRNKPRSSLQYRNDARPAWYKAWSIYEELAEQTRSGRILPDAVMFNNLVDVLLHTYERCKLRGNIDLEAEGEAREVMRRLAFLHRDILNAGVPVPPALQNLVHPHPSGLLQYHRSRHPTASHSRRRTLRKRLEESEVYAEGQTDLPPPSTFLKKHRALPSRADRIAHLPSKHKSHKEAVGKWNNNKIRKRIWYLQRVTGKRRPTTRLDSMLWDRNRKELDMHRKRLSELSL